MKGRGGWAIAVLGGVGVACGSADFMGDPIVNTPSATDPSGSSAVGTSSCDGPTTLEKMDPSTLPPCCDGTAHCVPTAKVPGKVRGALATCEGGYCVPDSFLLSGGAPAPTCTSFDGNPGACISTCLPAVNDAKAILQQATCATGELCAPCIHPITKQSTGVCEIGKVAAEGCDDGGGGAASSEGGGLGTGPCPHTGPPVIDPSNLPPCGEDAHCLDKSLVSDPALAGKLSPCGTSGLCVPDTFIASGGQFIPPTCTSLGGFEGRCLNVVLPDVAGQKDLLPQSSCAASERCAPCYDPRDGTDTGACRQSCDPGPTNGPPACPHTGPAVFDPAKFPECSSFGGAHCLPSSMISPASAASLASCPGGACTPDSFIESAGRFVPPTCTAVGGAEGRCLHRSIPQVASQSNLTQSTCASYERCVPCFNPIDGTDTGACHQSCDPGPANPPYTFPNCCAIGGAYRGRCVPSSIVPSNEATNLSRDVCASASSLCVPSENLGASFHPPACTAFSVAYLGNYQGVCLSDCLQFSGLQDLIIKQGTCDAVHQCVPCYKPLGQPTGAPGCP